MKNKVHKWRGLANEIYPNLIDESTVQACVSIMGSGGWQISLFICCFIFCLRHCVS